MDFKTIENQIRIRERQYTVLSVTNFDELYEQLLAKGLQHEEVADERIPYWAELWPSAVGLAEHILAHRDLLTDKTALEMGCGLGLPAVVAASIGAHVTATDYLQDAVDFAEKNALKNDIHNIQFHTLDWRKPDTGKLYDILLASDVAYERRQFEPLLHAFKHLVKPGGLILLSEPNRYIAEPFIAELQSKGYEMEQFGYVVEVRTVKSRVSVYAIINR